MSIAALNAALARLQGLGTATEAGDGVSLQVLRTCRLCRASREAFEITAAISASSDALLLLSTDKIISMAIRVSWCRRLWQSTSMAERRARR